MNRHPAADAWQILLMLLVRPVAIGALAFVAVAGLVYCAGRGRAQDAKVVALVDTVRITDSVAVVRTETVTVVQRRVDTVRAVSDALDSAVVIQNDSTVLVQDSTQAEPRPVVIPPVVVADLRALRLTVATQDTLVVSLYARDTTRLWQIASRDKLIRELSKTKRLERWAGVTYDVRERYASLTAGASVNVWRGFGADLYIDQPLLPGERAYIATRVGYWRTF